MQPGGRIRQGKARLSGPSAQPCPHRSGPWTPSQARRTAGRLLAHGSSGIQALLQAAQQAQQRGGPLTDEDWLRRDWRLRNPAGQSALYNL